MRRTKNTPKVPADALAAARAAAAELDREQALRAAQRQAAGLLAERDAAQAAQRAARTHHTGRGCARCGATHPLAGWSTTVGVDNMPPVVCTPCADPQAGIGNDGWSRPVLAEWQVRGVLLSRLLGVGDIPWLAVWGEQRNGLTFPFAAELDLPEGDRAPWSHVDNLDAWWPVAVEAARRQRAFGAPKVLGATIDGLSVDDVVSEWAGYRAAVNQAGPIDRVHLARRRPDLPEWTQEQIEAAEERALAERLAALDAEELATAARIAEQADRKARADARGLLDRRIRRDVAEYEKRLRRQAAVV